MRAMKKEVHQTPARPTQSAFARRLQISDLRHPHSGSRRRTSDFRPRPHRMNPIAITQNQTDPVKIRSLNLKKYDRITLDNTESQWITPRGHPALRICHAHPFQPIRVIPLTHSAFSVRCPCSVAFGEGGFDVGPQRNSAPSLRGFAPLR